MLFSLTVSADRRLTIASVRMLTSWQSFLSSRYSLTENGIEAYRSYDKFITFSAFFNVNLQPGNFTRFERIKQKKCIWQLIAGVHLGKPQLFLAGIFNYRLFRPVIAARRGWLIWWQRVRAASRRSNKISFPLFYFSVWMTNAGRCHRLHHRWCNAIYEFRAGYRRYVKFAYATS